MRKLPEWLKNVQENSWEIELLISGGAIFALFQLTDVFIKYINEGLALGINLDITVFLITGVFALKILTIGFIAHLIFRSFWLALICINYVYPNGIKKVKHRKPFSSNLKPNDDLQYQIYQLDRIAGLVMFCAVFLVVFVVGITSIYFFLCVLPFVVFNLPYIYQGFFNILLLIYILDFVLFGLLRKTPLLNYLLFPLFKIFDFFSFRKFYKRPLALYSTNIPKKVAFIGFSFLVALSFLFTYNTIYEIMYWPYLFDNRPHLYHLTEEEKPEMRYSEYKDYLIENNLPPDGPYIPSKIISGNFLEVYIPYKASHSNNYNLEEPLSQNFSVEVDGKKMKVDWFKFNDFNRVYTGLSTFIDINEFKPGKHILSLKSKSNQTETQIVFWKDYN